ncbi:MAG: alpha/beta hydrolase [Sphingobacteriales bacterium]|nr:alpha/beta hydrolase [Sphingobacteriales bacterium]
MGRPASIFLRWWLNSILLISLQTYAQSAAVKVVQPAGFSDFVKSTFVYANNKDYNGYDMALDADVYKPNLFSVKLPLVIIYHGGGYASGNKEVGIVKSFADYFTRANITAVVPNFRQGWPEYEMKPFCESVSGERFEDAAYRAYQDNRALIRYCKANAVNLGIDTNKIFLFGISSGGFLVNHHVYLDDKTTSPDRVARLGKLDYQGNAYTNSTDIAGIISVVGGIYRNDLPIIKEIPMLLFNNTCDGAVNFFNGWIGNCSNAVRSYGPGIFTRMLEQYDNPYSLHVFCGYNHGFLSESSPVNADPVASRYIADKSVGFIKGIADVPPSFSTYISSDSISLVPLDKCTNFETFYWCKQDSLSVENPFFSFSPNPLSCAIPPKLSLRYPSNGTFQIIITDELGRNSIQQKVEYHTSQNIIYLNNSDFTAGINIMTVKDSVGKVVYKTKVVRYCE